jgi:phage head maturation protease
MSKLNFYGQIIKADEEKRLVYGYASTEALDSHGEIISKEALEGALDDYMKFANIREMHQPSAVGTTESAEMKDKGLYICAKVVDDIAWKKVKEGVYKGFSIGGKMITKVDNKITKMKLTEISLVDRPACPEAIIEVFKLADEKENDMTTQISKTESQEEIQKGMDTVARLACLIRELSWLASDTEWEKQCEGDASQIPAALRDAVKNLSGILVAHTVEEVVEQQERLQEQVVPTEADAQMAMSDAGQQVAVVENAAKTEDITKAGKRNSKADQDKINQMLKLLKEMGADEESEEGKTIEEGCGTKKADAATDIAKADDIQKRADEAIAKVATLEADLKKLADERDAVSKRVKELEAMPAASKGVAKAVTIEKSDDVGAQQQKAEPKTAFDIIKAIQSGRM